MSLTITSLYMDNNQIADITPLSGLTNLIYLGLQDNQITDISPLSGLNSLEFLYLSGNRISDTDIKKLRSQLPLL